MSRWDGPDGQWATFRESYSWGASRRINAAMLSDDVMAVMVALATETVTGLHVRDMDGGWLDAPGEDAWERMDGKTGESISERCMEVWVAWRTAQDPKGSTRTPTDSPPPEA